MDIMLMVNDIQPEIAFSLCDGVCIGRDCFTVETEPQTITRFYKRGALHA